MTESRRGSREREQIRNDRIIRDRRRERKGVKQEGDVDGGEGQNCLDLPRPAKTSQDQPILPRSKGPAMQKPFMLVLFYAKAGPSTFSYLGCCREGGKGVHQGII